MKLTGLSLYVYVCLCVCLLTANKWMSVHLSGIVVICIARRLRCFSFMNEMRVNLFRSFHTLPSTLQRTVVQTSKRPGKPTTQPNPPLTSQPRWQAGRQSASHPPATPPASCEQGSNLPQNGRQQVKPESNCRNLQRFVGDATSFAFGRRRC